MARPGWSRSGPDHVRETRRLVKSFKLHLKAGDTFRLLLTNNHPSGNHSSQLVVHEVQAFRETRTSQVGGEDAK
jgi:hypothetical protein